jgi:DNA mismatch repair protein MutS
MASATQSSSVTPSRQQYLDIKAQHPDAIVFFRLGDFYETFDADAETAARELDLVLTSRPQGKGVRTPMAGVPHHAAEGYIARLIAKGYKVALCEQTSATLINGLMPREVVRVFTAGTVIEPGMLDAGRNNYLTAVIREDDHYGLAYADITTGEFAVTVLNGRRALTEELARLHPAELLVPENDITLYDRPKPSARCPPGALKKARRGKLLLRHFQRRHPGRFWHRRQIAGRARRRGHSLLPARNAARRHRPDSAARHYSTEGYMALDSNTRRNLELTGIAGRGAPKFAAGHPGQNRHAHGRAPAAQTGDPPPAHRRRPSTNGWIRWRRFASDALLRAEIRATLKGLPDLERLTNRVLSGKAVPAIWNISSWRWKRCRNLVNS